MCGCSRTREQGPPEQMPHMRYVDTCSVGATLPFELCTVGALWHAFLHASARYCAPLSTIPAGTTIPAEVAADVRAGRSPLLARAR